MMAVVEQVADRYLHFPTPFGNISVEPGDFYRLTDDKLAMVVRDKTNGDGSVSQAILDLTVGFATNMASGATAGTPGTFTPPGASRPYSIAQMGTVTADPATAWTIGQHVVTGNGGHTYWNGTAWAAGEAA